MRRSLLHGKFSPAVGDEALAGNRKSFGRLAHPRRTWAFLVGCIVIAVAAFGLGTFVRSADATVLDARDQQIPVYAVVDSRAVTESIRIQGEVIGSDTYTVHASLPDGAARAVVTATAVPLGATVASGALIGTVSDRPVFALALEIPLYRDIQPGKSGSDVSSLQDCLGVPTSGLMDWRTLEAVRALYKAVDIVPPGGWGNGTYVKLSEFASLPRTAEPPVMRTIAPVGSLMEPGASFAELSLGSSFVSVRASVSEAYQISVNGKASVQVAGGAAEDATVSFVGPFQPKATDAGRPPGKDIRIQMSEDTRLLPGQFASVLFGSATQPSPAVPTLAIRSDSGGEYVLRKAKDGQSDRVAVLVVRNANGWTAIESDDLKTGDEVLVSP